MRAFLLLVLALLAIIASAQRIDRNLATGWRSIRQDVPGAESQGFDDRAWRPVTIPHTWNKDDGADGGDDYYRGPGWYRFHLLIGPDLKGKSLFLHFEAASTVADVYLDGAKVGHHDGGFGAFCLDITKRAKPGDNVLAVRVTNAKDPNVAPLSGDFTIYGGLYRPVHLLALSPIGISPLDDASPGVYMTPEVTGSRASVGVRAVLRNDTAKDAQVDLGCIITDAKGKLIASRLEHKVIPAGSSADGLERLVIDQPHLWDGVNDPYLYKTTVEVRQNGKVLDHIEQPLGLRWFSVDPHLGLQLNGHPYDMHGVNIHQGRPSVGWASSPKMQEQDYAMVHELGATGVRLPHYQHCDYEYTLCDRYGLVCWAELCLVNHMTDSPEFKDITKQQLRELIKQNYNHPSIFFWSMYNEPAIDRKIGDGEWDLVKDLVALARQLDPKRLTTGAASMAVPERMNWYMDVTSFNRYWGWYDGEADNSDLRLNRMLQESHDRPFGFSEWGAGASIKQHEIPPKHPKTDGPWHPEEWQSETHEKIWAAIRDKPWMWCKLLWVMFDFPSDGRHEGDHDGINDKGLVTGDRLVKKDAFYFYKAQWTTAPMVYITSRRFNPRPAGPADIKVYSTCSSVELVVDGHSLGFKTSPSHVFVWPAVPLAVGSVKVEARGSGASDSVTWTMTR